MSKLKKRLLVAAFAAAVAFASYFAPPMVTSTIADIGRQISEAVGVQPK